MKSVQHAGQSAGRRAAGFTLIELLTTIAIIALLVGILVPSLSAARNQARNAATAGLISSVEKGCEGFRTETNAYPRSGGYNPFESNPTAWALTGAQWLTVQLVGVDQQGYVKPKIENDAFPLNSPDGKIDFNDWRAWYDVESVKQYTRIGPYFEPSPQSIKTPQQFQQEDLADVAPPDGMLGGSSDWSNARIPMLVDAHGFPVLYYRANPYAEQPIATGTGGSLKPGIYDQSHNGLITGYDAQNGELPLVGYNEGWDLASSGDGVNPAHPMGLLGYDESKPTSWPADVPSFGSVVLNRSIFDTTGKGGGSSPGSQGSASQKGKLTPHKPEGFLLIAAGRDGTYGTADDIRNFNQE